MYYEYLQQREAMGVPSLIVTLPPPAPPAPPTPPPAPAPAPSLTPPDLLPADLAPVIPAHLAGDALMDDDANALPAWLGLPGPAPVEPEVAVPEVVVVVRFCSPERR